MSKELILYGSLYEQNVTSLIEGLEAATEAVSIRVSSGGGSPEDTFGIIAKMAEFDYDINIKVDGKAFSSAAFLLAYAKKVTALDVSEFMFHRAAYPQWLEQDGEFFTDEIQGNLERINASLRAALEAKINVKKFERMAKVSMDTLFSMDGRAEVFLDAKQAKAIGLIDEITKITPKKMAEIESFGARIAAEYQPKSETEFTVNHTKMNIEELKANHPTLVAQLHAEGVEKGIEQERDRVGAWMAFAEDDLAAVTGGVKAGKEISKTEMAELNRKANATAQVKEAEANSTTETETEEAANVTSEAAKEEKITADFMAELKNELGIQKG